MFMHFADVSSSDTTAVVGAFVTVILGFLGVAKIMLSAATKERDADRHERKELGNAIKLMATSSNKVAAATERGANEAKQRNGHLAELVTQQAEIIQGIADVTSDKIITTLEAQNVNEQTIQHQHVHNSSIDKEIVEHETVKNKKGG